MKRSIFLFFPALLALQACIKDKPLEPASTKVNASGQTVLVVNEGNFGYDNASVSLYDPASGSVAQNYYAQQNNNEVLGDVCQSITRYNSSYYIVVNNSSKIVVANTGNFARTAVITGFTSPRYLLPVTPNKAYVSDLYSNSVQVVNLASNSITASIPCNGATEEMRLIYNKVFVAGSASGYVYVINTLNDQVSDSVQVAIGASSLVFDKNDKLWALASGGTSAAGKLLRINPLTLQVEQSLTFPSGEKPQHLCINKTKDTLYYLNNGVYQLPVQNTQLPASALIPQGSKLFYGIAVNPDDHSIYVSDAIDYIQRSRIMIYAPDGSLKTSFNAGLIAVGFVFE